MTSPLNTSYSCSNKKSITFNNTKWKIQTLQDNSFEQYLEVFINSTTTSFEEYLDDLNPIANSTTNFQDIHSIPDLNSGLMETTKTTNMNMTSYTGAYNHMYPFDFTMNSTVAMMVLSELLVDAFRSTNMSPNLYQVHTSFSSFYTNPNHRKCICAMLISQTSP